jgi:hypothetical protein
MAKQKKEMLENMSKADEKLTVTMMNISDQQLELPLSLSRENPSGRT